MRVGLAMPPFFDLTALPLAPASLAAVLRQGGHQVVALDLNRAVLERFRRDFPTFPLRLWDERQPRHPGQAVFSWLAFGGAGPRADPARAALLEQVEAAWGRPLAVLAEPYRRITDAAAAELAACDLVGVSLNPFTLLAGAHLAARIKGLRPQAVVVAGGVLCADAGLAKSLLACFPQFDLAVAGEGEATLAELVRDLEAGGRGAVPGVLGRESPGGAPDVGRFVPRALLSPEELDGLPCPDFSFAPPRARLGAAIPVLSARGCVWGRCRFCSDRALWPGYRARSPRAVVQEIRTLARRHSNHRFMFLDLAFNADPDRALELCRLLAKSRLQLALWAQIRADLVSPGLFAAMRRAGFVKVQVGLEALPTRLLDAMGKGTTALDNVRSVRLALEAGLEVVGNLISHHPGETPEDLKETLALMRRLPHLFNRSTILGLYPFVVRRGAAPHPAGEPTFPAALFPASIRQNVPVLEWWPRAGAAPVDGAAHVSAAPADAAARAGGDDGWAPIRQAARRRPPRVPLSYVDLRDRLVVYGLERGRVAVLRGRARPALLALRDARRRQELVEAFSPAPGAAGPAAGEEVLAGLLALGLVFEEDGRLVSVALPWRSEPACGR